MASFNLIRNSRVFFTTNVNTTGVVQTTGFTAVNTQEIQVMDGFSFTQATNADTIQIMEAGASPTRGQRAFNTSLNPVDFSFSTYVRPKLVSTLVKAEEAHLWNALLSTAAIGSTAGPSIAVASTATTFTTVTVTAGVATLIGTGFTAGIPANAVVVVKGVTGLGASQFNTAIKLSAASTTTNIVGTYLTAPTAAAVLGNWTSAVTFNNTSWNENIAAAADTLGPLTSGAAVAYSSVTTGLSNKNTLLPFGMIMVVDGVTYAIDNCAMDQAVVEFGLDGISMIAWTGKGTALRQAFVLPVTTATNGTFGNGYTGNYGTKTLDAKFITNKLSTVTLISNIAGFSGTSYTLALTGGSLTIANNITYVTPANLGVVNIPVGYFTGTRAVSGSLQAYLRTGTLNTGGLLDTMLTNAATSIDPKFKLQVEIGGSSNPVRVEVEANGAMLQIPTIDAQAVMSTTINFTAQAYDTVVSATSGYDIENTNELIVRYLSN